MSQSMSFGNIILANSGKRGILKPIDDSGYYRVNAGGFNVPNRGGIAYRANEYIRECMGADSDLNRRVARGEVYCELGHPNQYYLEKINGQIVRTKIVDIFEWILRLKTIDMNNVCGHIRKIIWEMDGGINAPIYNLIEVKPFGPFQDVLAQSLETPDVNTAFSIRTVTKPQRMGDRVREVDYFTNYDFVVEPGMAHANKHQTAGLEDYLSNCSDGNELVMNLDGAINHCERMLTSAVVMNRYEGTESLKEITGMLDVLKQVSRQQKTAKLVRCDSLGLFR